MKRTLLLSIAGLVAALAAGAAQARDNVSWSVTLTSPGYDDHYAPAPVYVEAPVVYAPRPVYVGPAPVVWASPGHPWRHGYGHRHGHGHGHGLGHGHGHDRHHGHD